MQLPQNTRIEGIRKTNVGSWAIVLSYPVGHDGSRAQTLGLEFRGAGAKAAAIAEAGTNRVIA